MTVKRKASKTQGWYTFANGTKGWYHGLSASEKRVEERKYGKVIKFEHTEN